VLAPLVLGFVLIAAFILWEAYGAKNPMFPKRLRQEPRILGLTLVITFISGANFFSILMFWPTQAFNVYGHGTCHPSHELCWSPFAASCG